MDESTPTAPLDDHDELLAVWVTMANEQGILLPVTLQIGGLLVTGQLIGIAAYFQGLGENFAATTSDAVTQQAWRDAFNQKVESFRTPPDDTDDQRPFYIHLRDARFVHTNGTLIPQTGVLWRGRLTAVDGWWFGVLESDRK